MSHLRLTAQKRTPDINPKALRRAGKIPAVLYGHQGTQSLDLEIEGSLVRKFLEHASINNTIIDLKVEGGWAGTVLLREKQMDSLLQTPKHFSFFAIAGHGSITMNLPLVFVGDAPGVARDSGVMEKVLTEVSISASPDLVPESIEVDVSKMEIDSVLHVSDLILPAGIVTVGDPARVVVIIKSSVMSQNLTSLDGEEAPAATA